MIMPQSHWSTFAKFRSEVARLRIETGRYEGLCINDRTCPFCKNCTEDEFHVLFKCPPYNEHRIDLFRNVNTYDPTFDVLNEKENCCVLFNNPQMLRSSAKTRFYFLILQRRLLC